MEFRIKGCQLQADEDGLLKIGGYINVTERESEMLFNKRSGKWFKEVMRKGVFQKAIDKAKGIPLLFEHNWSKQLASTDEGNLTLKEDNIGLRFDAVIDDVSVYEQVKAGIINSCSFGFRALQEEIESVNNKFEKRFVSAIELLEVSLVKNPAYVGSLCESRSYEEELQEEKDKQVIEDEPKKEDLDEKIEEEIAEGKLEGEKDEEKCEALAEEADEKAEEENSESKEETEVDKRSDEESALVEAQPELDKEYLVKIVEELIEAKMNEIKDAEELELAKNQEEEVVKEIHKEIEKELEKDSMTQSAEVVKLRLQLLKLKDIKRGI